MECPQPLGANCALLPLWGEMTGFDPEIYDACGVHVDSVDLTQEVSFGRGSVARAQDFVIDSAYAEFIKTINEAEDIGFDPANPIRLGLPLDDGEAEEILWKTIDAPLENLVSTQVLNCEFVLRRGRMRVSPSWSPTSSTRARFSCLGRSSPDRAPAFSRPPAVRVPR